MTFKEAIMQSPFNIENFLEEYNTLMRITNIESILDTIKSPLEKIKNDIDDYKNDKSGDGSEHQENEIFDRALLIGRILSRLCVHHRSNMRLRSYAVVALLLAGNHSNKNNQIKKQALLLLNKFLYTGEKFNEVEPFKDILGDINKFGRNTFRDIQPLIDGKTKERKRLQGAIKNRTIIALVVFPCLFLAALVPTAAVLPFTFGWLFTLTVLIVSAQLALRDEDRFEKEQIKINRGVSDDHEIFNKSNFNDSVLLNGIFEIEKKTSNKSRATPSSDFTIEVSHRNIGPDAEAGQVQKKTPHKRKR